MYNNYGGYNRPPGYGAPPGMAAPPGLGPPGAGAAPPGVTPPGVQFNGPPQLGGPRPLPANFQPPAGMPNINFSAPVIRLGTSNSQRGGNLDSVTGTRSGGAGTARRGLGMDDRDSRREDLRPLHPPTREEIARTIFVGNIPDGVGGDGGVERILETAGNFTRFTRAKDANDKVQTFGFAEYADAQSLRTATELFNDVHVPTKRQSPGEKKDKAEIETTKLMIVVDDASVKYAEDWTKNDDENTIQFRLDTAKEALDQVIASLFNPPDVPQTDLAGDSMMTDPHGPHDENAEFVNIDIPPSGEDDLSDIPAEMRETVAAEIAAFRDRSNQRDLERLRKEDEIANEQRGGANGVPVGPRADRGIQGVPSGPKGSQFPRDYQGNMKFVNGEAMINGGIIRREDDDDSASDSELEERRKKKRDTELDADYERMLNRWLRQEGRSVSSLERTHIHMKNKEAEEKKAREAAATYLKNFDDDEEEARRGHLYYRDHGAYMRERQRFREREERDDGRDRQEEEREMATRQKQKAVARDQADAFLNEQAEEMLRAQSSREPEASFKISLGAATKKLEKSAAPRRTAAEVENLLEDEEANDPADTKKRTLIPINFDASVRANLTEEEVEAAQKQLARDIPADKEGLWNWPVAWDHLLEKYIDEDIMKWSANKVLELLGVQEDMIVDTIANHLKSHKSAESLVEHLEPVLEDDAEGLVKKLWRMVIFFSEQEKKGLK